jgi:hypothetical protein
MQEMTQDTWQRLGSSIVWEKTLVLPLVEHERPHALRELLVWHATHTFPTIPARCPFVVTGLQTCIELLTSPDEVLDFLTRRIRPLVRHWQNEFPESGLIFTMNCAGSQWDTDSRGYPRWKLTPHRVLPIGQGLWNGAADQAMRIIAALPSEVAPTKKTAKTTATTSFGGLYVRRLS